MSQLVRNQHRQREFVAAQIDSSQREQLFLLAREEDRSVSAILRRAIQRELDLAKGQRCQR